MTEQNFCIGIDLGGTRIKGVLVDESGNMIKSVTSDTYVAGAEPGNIAPWKDEIVSMISQLQTGVNIHAIGLSAPGLSDESNRSIAFMPGRLQELENFQWHRLLKQKRILVLNDAHAALIAESQFGAGRGVKNILMVTLGTGVGGALLIDGQLHQGFLQRAGHVGHMSLNNEGHQGILDIPGTFEEAFGNASVLRRSCGKFKSALDMVEAYRSGDTLGSFFWLTSVQKLSLALASLINIVSPELIILGGGITKAKEALTDPLTEFMNIYEWRPGGRKTLIKLATFSEYSGAIGAAIYAQTHKESNDIERVS